MARVPMVTRTIITTKVNVLCMDITTAEPFNKELILPRTYKDETKLLKAVRGVIDTDSIKAVSVVDTEVVETLYGMSEQAFIDGAMILDPSSRKAVESDTVEVSE